MNKLLVSTLTVVISFILIGCELDSSNSSSESESFLHSRNGIVIGKNDPYSGVSYMKSLIVENQNEQLLVMPETIVMKERSSGSGLSEASANDINVGDPIIWFFYMENANYDGSPKTIVIEEVWIFNDTNSTLYVQQVN